MRTILTLIALLSLYQGAYSSVTTDSTQIIYFQLTDAVMSNSVRMAHIMNLNQGVGTISDMLGYYHLPFFHGDTLTITAIGYHTMRLPYSSLFKPDSLYTLRMTPRSYELREVVVTRFSSYQRFIHEATKMDLPLSDQEMLVDRLESYIRRTISNMDFRNLPSEVSGVGFGKDWHTIQMEKIEQRRHEEQRWDIMLRKFSATVVMELTDLKGPEVIRFMDFCQFTERYLLTASEYEVKERIIAKYQVYRQQQGLERGSN